MSKQVQQPRRILPESPGYKYLIILTATIGLSMVRVKKKERYLVSSAGRIRASCTAFRPIKALMHNFLCEVQPCATLIINSWCNRSTIHRCRSMEVAGVLFIKGARLRYVSLHRPTVSHRRLYSSSCAMRERPTASMTVNLRHGWVDGYNIEVSLQSTWSPLQ